MTSDEQLTRDALRARNRHHRRHGTGPLALFIKLIDLVRWSTTLEEAERRTRQFLRRHKRRFNQFTSREDDVVAVVRHEIWYMTR